MPFFRQAVIVGEGDGFVLIRAVVKARPRRRQHVYLVRQLGNALVAVRLLTIKASLLKAGNHQRMLHRPRQNLVLHGVGEGGQRSFEKELRSQLGNLAQQFFHNGSRIAHGQKGRPKECKLPYRN